MIGTITKEGFKTILSTDIKANESALIAAAEDGKCLLIKPVNKWIEEAKARPIPNMLFSELWYEGELVILYADTNVGKSILAVQIAESISSGVPIPNFKLEADPKITLYLDFELSDKQFEKRYSENYRNHFVFNENFFRAEINPLADIPKRYKGVEDYLCDQLQSIITEHSAEIIIIDNLTFLGNDNEKSKYALVLMKQLKRITKELSISIMVLAHTPKRDESKPISKNDLAGSKMLINFSDSAFAIGLSDSDPSFRYIKQIKQRNTEHLYHAENVIVCMLAKENNFLQFKFQGFGYEKNHLQSNSNIVLEDRDEQMKFLIEQGISNVKIAKQLGISEGAVRKRKKALDIK